MDESLLGALTGGRTDSEVWEKQLNGFILPLLRQDNEQIKQQTSSDFCEEAPLCFGMKSELYIQMHKLLERAEKLLHKVCIIILFISELWSFQNLVAYLSRAAVASQPNAASF